MEGITEGLLAATARGLLAVLATVLALGFIGAVYQRLSEVQDLKRYRPPGRLIDIGGRRLHLLCEGSAPGPTVVIEAGSGDDSTLWDGMVRRVSAFARVCTYDRAGLGWSDPVSGSRTIDDRAGDLKTLLAAAGLPGPFVLVGHSYGGLIVRRFAANSPAAVAGVVLIEASEEVFAYAPDGRRDGRAIAWRAWRTGWLVRLGLTRLGTRVFPDWFDPVRGVPAEVHGLMTALFLRTSRHFARVDELASYAATPPAWRMAHGFGTLGDIPLAVVSRGIGTFPEWQEAQRRLAALSTVSTQIVAEQSDHVIQFTEPELIVGAIRQVRAAAEGAWR
jgi:pimeloyl-ACP methyl ester carboxylesterase